MSQTLVVCPYCGCGCSFYIEEKDGRAVGVTPSTDHPVSRGSLCVKGWRAYEFINHPERLRSPMIRDGGLVREATWEEATDLIVENLLDIKEKHGSDALAFLSSAKLTNEENYLFMKMARATFKTNNVDHCARL
jgi:predicted molibdopterin-dependent oxidoreductase YjgC